MEKKKWKSLAECNEGYALPEYKGISDELMEKYHHELEESLNIPVEICRI